MSSDDGSIEAQAARAAEEAASPAPDLGLRLASPDDAWAIASIATLGWQRAYRGILPDDYLDGLTVERREQAWFQLLSANPVERAPAWLAVAEKAGEGGVAVGFASTGPSRDDDAPPDSAEVYAIYVLPETWRRGIGRALLKTAAGWWRARGTATLLLWVLEKNARARRFYEALGWSPDGGRQEIVIAGTSVIEVRYRIPLR